MALLLNKKKNNNFRIGSSICNKVRFATSTFCIF